MSMGAFSVQGELKHTVNHTALHLHSRSSAALAIVHLQQQYFFAKDTGAELPQKIF